MKCRQIVEWLEKLAPVEWAESWDNTGLAFGNMDNEVKRILVALEPTEDVIDQAIEVKADMVITHHPMIFKPIKSIDYDTVLGRKIIKLAKNDIVAYSMHTNLDVAVMAQEAARLLELDNVVRLQQISVRNEFNEEVNDKGLGSIGILRKRFNLEECAVYIKNKLNIEKLHVIGDLNSEVNKVAILPGSGKSFIEIAKNQEVDVFITGDIDYHSAVDASQMGINIIDAGHFGTEYLFVEFMYNYLVNNEHNKDIDVICASEKCPFVEV